MAETTQHFRKTPTDRMVQALKNWEVPAEEISKMTFEQARDRLDALIKAAEARKNRLPSSQDTAEPIDEKPVSLEYDVKAEAIDAKRFVEREFGTGDYFTGAIVAELMREKFSMFMSEKIQKNKIANMAKIKR